MTCVHGKPASCAACVDEFLARLYRTLRDRGELDLTYARIVQELDGLPQQQAKAMRLCFLEGLTHEQAAQTMGVSRVAVTRLVKRGRRALLARLAT